jgi:hypothetical protein
MEKGLNNSCSAETFKYAQHIEFFHVYNSNLLVWVLLLATGLGLDQAIVYIFSHSEFCVHRHGIILIGGNEATRLGGQ